MSYCEIISFKNKKQNDSLKCSNAWGGAAFIWTILYNKYLKDPNKDYDTWTTADTDKHLWDLAKSQNLSFFERAVHIATFDMAVIEKRNFFKFINDLESFSEAYPAGNSVCHLLTWSRFIETCQGDAIGFYATSVGENPWHNYDEEEDEEIQYDFKQNKHFEVYDYLQEMTTIIKQDDLIKYKFISKQ